MNPQSSPDSWKEFAEKHGITRRPSPTLTGEMQRAALIVSHIIRNALEDFHCRHLSDEQMRELNSIIRNAVATALHALEHAPVIDAAQRYLDYHSRAIPRNWEPPELLAGYVQMWRGDPPTSLTSKG